MLCFYIILLILTKVKSFKFFQWLWWMLELARQYNKDLEIMPGMLENKLSQTELWKDTLRSVKITFL